MSYTKKLPVGSLGLCYAPILLDKWGEAYIHYIPEGPWTAEGKYPPGHYKVHALEDIRSFRDIIIVDANNGAIEHTPQELKYMNRTQQWQNVDLDYPLPVTMGTKDVIWNHLLATAAGNTLFITPTTGKYVRVHFIGYGSRHNVLAVVGMRFTAIGAIRHIYPLPANGGIVLMNLTDTCWDGAVNEALLVWLNAGYANGIDFNIGYTEEER